VRQARTHAASAASINIGRNRWQHDSVDRPRPSRAAATRMEEQGLDRRIGDELSGEDASRRGGGNHGEDVISGRPSREGRGTLPRASPSRPGRHRLIGRASLDCMSFSARTCGRRTDGSIRGSGGRMPRAAAAHVSVRPRRGR